MKTLNEVIKSFEWCVTDDHDECDGCPYNTGKDTDCHERNIDALHYLKAYKEDKDDLTALRAYWAEQQANPALTWDELKNMVGKPVWVEALLYKQWAVIAYIGEEYIRFEGANLYAPECRIYMGEDNGWQAYRKERTNENTR